MLTLRKSAERGHADHGWLKTRHSFSFADYYDPAHMGWGNLRVINEDRIAPGTGFGTHGHRDMEIVSIVLAGALAHRDGMGNGTLIPAGEVQRMSAGTGVMHSEFNAADAETHFLQIWSEPWQRGLAPGYEQKRIAPAAGPGGLRLVASPDGAGDSLRIHADAALRMGILRPGEAVELPLDPQRKAYVFLVRGRLEVNGQALADGDAALLAEEALLRLAATSEAEVLVFDLAP